MRILKKIGTAATLVVLGTSLASSYAQTGKSNLKKKPMVENIVVAGGCFWCLEPIFRMTRGVKDVEVAYVGGARPNVTYEQVCMGNTGHAEALKVSFDANTISKGDILRLFFTIHDPTTKDRQGGDAGTQYRSAIFYANSEEKALAEKIIQEINAKKIWPRPVVTTIEPIKNYTRAEEYHQDYYRKYETATPEVRAKMNGGYCQFVIEPKVRKFREKLLQAKG